MECPVDVAAGDPEEEKNEKDSTTDHAEEEVKFLIVPVGVDVLSEDEVLVIVSEGLELALRIVNTACLSRPEDVRVGSIVPPGENGVINEILFL